MKLKKKLIISFITMLVLLLALPFIFIKTAEPHEFMVIMMLLFFVVNPITTAIINSMFGKDIKKMWWMSLLFSVVFLLSYWLVLKEVIFDLMIYAGFYLIIGLIVMFVSSLIVKKQIRRKK